MGAGMAKVDETSAPPLFLPSGLPIQEDNIYRWNIPQPSHEDVHTDPAYAHKVCRSSSHPPWQNTHLSLKRTNWTLTEFSFKGILCGFSSETTGNLLELLGGSLTRQAKKPNPTPNINIILCNPTQPNPTPAAREGRRVDAHVCQDLLLAGPVHLQKARRVSRDVLATFCRRFRGSLLVR